MCWLRVQDEITQEGTQKTDWKTESHILMFKDWQDEGESQRSLRNRPCGEPKENGVLEDK